MINYKNLKNIPMSQNQENVDNVVDPETDIESLINEIKICTNLAIKNQGKTNLKNTRKS